MKAALFTDEELRGVVRARIRASGKSPAAFAISLGLEPEQLRQFMSGRRGAEPKVCAALGFERVAMYQPATKRRAVKA